MTSSTVKFPHSYRRVATQAMPRVTVSEGRGYAFNPSQQGRT